MKDGPRMPSASGGDTGNEPASPREAEPVEPGAMRRLLERLRSTLKALTDDGPDIYPLF